MRAVVILGAALVLALGACDPPAPAIRIYLSEGPPQDCGTDRCEALDIDSACGMYVSVRIVKPTARNAPFINICEPMVNPPTANNLCGLRKVTLPTTSIPYEDLEVEVAVFRDTQMTVGADGSLACPTDVVYDYTNGFAIPSLDATPVIAGRGYYHPGAETIDVTLGCPDLGTLIDDSCNGVGGVVVTAHAKDFDSQADVGNSDALDLNVSVGEPRSQDLEFLLSPVDLTTLDKVEGAPRWSGTVDSRFTTTVCLAVLDDTPQSTTAVKCTNTNVSTIRSSYDLEGTKLTKASLDRILSALSLTAFPAEGMTIGVVVNNGTPLGGQVVTSTSGTIKYLSSDRSAVLGNATSGGPNGGVFVSLDAPYGTVFSSARIGVGVGEDFGGRIAGKVTIVVLDVSQQTQPDD